MFLKRLKEVQINGKKINKFEHFYLNSEPPERVHFF